MGSSAQHKVVRAICWGPSGEVILLLKETQGFPTLVFSRLGHICSLMSGMCGLRGVGLSVGKRCRQGRRRLSLCSALCHVLASSKQQVGCHRPVIVFQAQRDRENAPFCGSLGASESFPWAAQHTPIPASFARIVSLGLS